MKILIAADLEGISGICVWDQTRDRDSIYYQEARRLLMGDTSAAVDGCLEAGANEVFVEDEHGGGFNIIPELMHPKAKYITGKSRLPMSQRTDLYRDFDGVILLGHHAKVGTSDGLLNHTQSSLGQNRYWYNGIEMGEIGQAALRFGHFDIPIIMVAGDDATCREAHELLGESVTTVSVKKGLTVEYAILLSPSMAHEKIREGAKTAVLNMEQCRPYKTELPIVGRLRFPDKTKADSVRLSGTLTRNVLPLLSKHRDEWRSPTPAGADLLRRSKRIDDYTFEASFESQLDVYEF